MEIFHGFNSFKWLNNIAWKLEAYWQVRSYIREMDEHLLSAILSDVLTYCRLRCLQVHGGIFMLPEIRDFVELWYVYVAGRTHERLWTHCQTPGDPRAIFEQQMYVFLNYQVADLGEEFLHKFIQSICGSSFVLSLRHCRGSNCMALSRHVSSKLTAINRFINDAIVTALKTMPGAESFIVFIRSCLVK